MGCVKTIKHEAGPGGTDITQIKLNIQTRQMRGMYLANQLLLNPKEVGFRLLCSNNCATPLSGTT